MASLDSYILEPSGKREYLQNYGWHFSKKAYQIAVKGLRKRVSIESDKTEEVKPYSIEQVDEMLLKYGIRLKNDAGYDKAYIATMAKADYYGTSIEDELHLMRFVRDFLDDVDGGEERAFRHWYSDMIEKGKPVMWEEMM